jgi:hypothetical protein
VRGRAIGHFKYFRKLKEKKEGKTRKTAVKPFEKNTLEAGNNIPYKVLNKSLKSNLMMLCRILLFVLALGLAVAAPPQRTLRHSDDAPPDPPCHVPLITDEGRSVYRCCEATSTRGTLCQVQPLRRGSQGCILLPSGEMIGPYRLSELVLQTPRAPRAPPLTASSSAGLRRLATPPSTRLSRNVMLPPTDDDFAERLAGAPPTPPAASQSSPVADPPAPPAASQSSPVADPPAPPGASQSSPVADPPAPPAASQSSPVADPPALSDVSQRSPLAAQGTSYDSSDDDKDRDAKYTYLKSLLKHHAGDVRRPSLFSP